MSYALLFPQVQELIWLRRPQAFALTPTDRVTITIPLAQDNFGAEKDVLSPQLPWGVAAGAGERNYIQYAMTKFGLLPVSAL